MEHPRIVQIEILPNDRAAVSQALGTPAREIARRDFPHTLVLTIHGVDSPTATRALATLAATGIFFRAHTTAQLPCRHGIAFAASHGVLAEIPTTDGTAAVDVGLNAYRRDPEDNRAAHRWLWVNGRVSVHFDTHAPREPQAPRVA